MANYEGMLRCCITCRVMDWRSGFVLIINGFVKLWGGLAGGIPMKKIAPAVQTEPEVEDSDFQPLTAEEAQALRQRNPELSPVWVVIAQVGVGLLGAGLAWLIWQRSGLALSVFYGALAVAIPAALFVHGTRSRPVGVSHSVAMLRFAVWEVVKIVLTVVMLALAPWIFGTALSWLALLAGVVLALKMYWVALLVRPKLLNRY